MAHHGSPGFEAYTRNLRRLLWADFIEAQMSATRPAQFRASLVDNPLPDTDNLAHTFEYHRNRGSSISGE
jgi:hypothetical protein